jgi:hypothetical protein
MTYVENKATRGVQMANMRHDWNVGAEAGKKYVRQHRLLIIESAMIGTGVFEFVRYWRLNAQPAAAAIAVIFFFVGPAVVFWLVRKKRSQDS